MILALDIDGVLADFNAAFAGVLTGLTEAEFPLDDPEWPAVWDWPQAAGVSPAELDLAWAHITRYPDWWRGLTPLPGVTFTLQALEQDHDLYFFTARPNGKHETEEWLHDWGHLKNPTVIRTLQKGATAAALKVDLLVDDCPQVVLDVLDAVPDCRVLLVDRPYNRWVQPAFRQRGGDVIDGIYELPSVLERIAV